MAKSVKIALQKPEQKDGEPTNDIQMLSKMEPIRSSGRSPKLHPIWKNLPLKAGEYEQETTAHCRQADAKYDFLPQM